MKRIQAIFPIYVLVFAVAGRNAHAQTTGADSVYSLAERMVSDGDAVTGRSLVDSMVRAARRGSPAHAEAIFWRASLAPSSQLAEQDYRRLLVEYPLYARTGDVLLRLAQLELFRGNRDAAARHLRRIQAEHPEYGNQASASYWLGRTLFENNDQPGACSAIASAKRLVKPDDIELKNQIAYQDQQCAGVVLIPRADPVPAAEAAPATSAGVPVSSGIGRAPDRGRTFSVQVAAYSRESQARSLASKLAARGLSARVDGKTAPFRVRVGNYPTEAEASLAQQRLKKSGIMGFVVRAD